MKIIIELPDGTNCAVVSYVFYDGIQFMMGDKLLDTELLAECKVEDGGDE